METGRLVLSYLSAIPLGIIFTMVTAYVFRFAISNSGLRSDYFFFGVMSLLLFKAVGIL